MMFRHRSDRIRDQHKLYLPPGEEGWDNLPLYPTRILACHLPKRHCYVRVLLQLRQLRGAEGALTGCPCTVDDSVYLSDEKERQEYVMNEDGIIYKGSGNYIFPMQWDFGQVNTHTC